MEILERSSPNSGPRRDGLRPSLVVLHYTAMATAEAALDRLSDPASEVSCHYLIAEDGRIWRLVPEDVVTIEQLQAEALVRMAQYFGQAGSATRGLDFTLPTLYTAPLDPDEDAGLAESVYGDMLDRRLLPRPRSSGTLLLEHAREPVELSGLRQGYIAAGERADCELVAHRRGS